jgi:CelD/BcsL family acetyltransferase involved in cellulose biosynthesis
MSDSFAISVFDDVDAVSADWPRSGNAADGVVFHPFQTVTFLKAWLASFGRSGKRSLHFVEVREGAGRPLLFIPLCISHRKGARILEYIDGDAADYNAPILFSTDIEWSRERAEQLWRDVTRALPPFDLVQLNKMPSDIDGMINPLGFMGDQAYEISCHGNDLRRPWADVEAAVPQRKTLLRKSRQIDRIAPLTFGIAGDDNERAEANAAFLRQKQQRFEQTMVPGFDTDADKLDFFRHGTERFAAEGMLALFYLKAGEDIIATIWGLTAGKRYYAIMLSFETGEWARYSPGSILFYRTLEWLHANGYEWLDLGVGDEAWKLESCETTFPLSARQEAVTFRGRALLLRSGAMAALRSTSLWRRLRPLKWIIRRRLRQAALLIAGVVTLHESLWPIAA